MDIRRITDAVSVSSQITTEDVPAAKQAGFRSLICNRPDGETDDQTAFAEIEHAAAAEGLSARYLPVISGQMTLADVQAFGAALSDMPGPILAYCRSGTRSATLWGLSQVGTLSGPDIVAAARDAGYDLRGIIPAR